jgi:hypothetical protein
MTAPPFIPDDEAIISISPAFPSYNDAPPMKVIAPAIPPFAKEFEPCIIKDEVITFLEEPTPMLTPPPE